MNKIRRTRKRPLRLEALEGRLTLSAGLAVASPHAHALVMNQTRGRIPLVFHGHTATTGSTQTTPDLAGRIGGDDRFTGSGSVTIDGKLVLGGDAELTNSQGSLELKFGSGSFTKIRGHRQEIPLVVVGATGKYAPFIGATGLGTTWNVPASPKKLSTFSGYINDPAT